jgi:hypothetical protein
VTNRPPVGLDADHHLGRVIDLGADQLVEASNALHPLGQSGLGQPLALLVHDLHIVVGLGPVHPYEDHRVIAFLLVRLQPG